MKYKKIDDNIKEKIFELRHQGKGKSYSDIVNCLLLEGIKTNITYVKEVYLELCQKKGISEPIMRKHNLLSDEKSVETLRELRENGKTYTEIVEYFKEQGINTNVATVQLRCKEFGIKKKKSIKNNKTMERKYTIPISDEEIFELREQKKSYTDIANYFKKKGISVSRETINTRCKNIYAEKGIVEPKGVYTKRKENKDKTIRHKVSEDEIYELKEKGLTYREISEYYKKRGINISEGYISKICTDTYWKKGERPPKAIKFKEIPISNEEIFELREKGMFYKEIQDYYNKKGIQISIPTLQKRCEKIYAEKGLKLPKTRSLRSSLYYEMEQAVQELNEELDALLAKKSVSEQLVKDCKEHYTKEEKSSEGKENEK